MDTQRPLRKNEVFVRKMEDECLLYDEEKGRIHVLNAIAGFVWEMCDGAHSNRDMEDRMREAWEVPGDANLTDDLHRIIGAFAELELFQPQRDLESS